MVQGRIKTISLLTILLTISLAVVSFLGAFDVNTYEREVQSMAAQGIGQDLVDLFMVVPLLVITLLYMLKGSNIAKLLHAGTVFYILYSFAVYSFGIHFNNLFLLYCLILGLSFYTFILDTNELLNMKIFPGNTEKIPVKGIAIFMILTAVMFYLLWLKDIVPAMIHNTVPKSVSDYDLLVNPVHVLDLSIALPALIISGVLILKKNRYGFIFAPVLLVFVIILTIALAGMVAVMSHRGVMDDTSLMGIFIALSIISGIFLYTILRTVKNE